MGDLSHWALILLLHRRFPRGCRDFGADKASPYGVVSVLPLYGLFRTSGTVRMLVDCRLVSLWAIFLKCTMVLWFYRRIPRASGDFALDKTSTYGVVSVLVLHGLFRCSVTRERRECCRLVSSGIGDMADLPGGDVRVGRTERTVCDRRRRRNGGRRLPRRTPSVTLTNALRR
jgi:hypothetical protein